MKRIIIIVFLTILALFASLLIIDTNAWMSDALLGVSASFIVVWITDFLHLLDRIKATRVNVKSLMAALCAELYSLYCSLDEMRQDGNIATYEAIGTALGSCRSTLTQICSLSFPTDFIGHKFYKKHIEIRNILLGKINDDLIRFSLLESAIIQDRIALIQDGEREIVTYHCTETHKAIDAIISILSEDYQLLVDKESTLCALHSSEFDWTSIKNMIEASRKYRDVSL